MDELKNYTTVELFKEIKLRLLQNPDSKNEALCNIILVKMAGIEFDLKEFDETT